MYVIAVVGTLVVLTYSMTWFRSKLDLGGKHVIITGGSEGLGLCLAKQFCHRRCRVTIIARTQSKLDQAINDLQALALPEVQVQAFPADVTQYQQVRRSKIGR